MRGCSIRTKEDEYICRDKKTGEQVKYIRKVCKCGHSMYFMQNHSAICGVCGATVYPSKKSEFKEKMEKMIRKNNYGSNE